MEPEFSQMVLAAMVEGLFGGPSYGTISLLWLLGVPLPILFLVWIVGGMH
jgi:hypothetical protein